MAKKRRTGAFNRNRGNAFERKIANELRELGFTGVKTSRSESKSMDNNKVDLFDPERKLPLGIQLKKTIATPSYFKIRKESTWDNETFCLIWSKQESGEVNMKTVGECVIIPKELFYKLIKSYYLREE